MVNISPTLQLVETVNANEPSNSIKIQNMSDYIQKHTNKQDLNICSLQETHSKIKKERARDTGLGAIESEEMTGIFSSVKRNGNKLRKARMNLRR